MTSYDDELAALMALDALEPDEQLDAELRLGTFPAPLRDTALVLAEGAAVPAPPPLRTEVLAAALSRRPPGRPADGVVACSPVEGFTRTVHEFRELLESLAIDEWDAVAHPEHGRVRDLVAHLIGIEQLSVPWLRGDPDAPILPDHVASTRETVAALASASAASLAARWQSGALGVLSAALDGDLRREVTFHDLRLSVEGYLVTRTFELWAHGMDIALATGRPLPMLDDERMAMMSSRLMGAVSGALAYRRTPVRGRTARFVLTGPAGGCYDVPLFPGESADEPSVVVVADAVEVCRLAARRLARDELGATIEGDHALAELVLAGLDAFARD
jgi:uncharacterized protein (TIGR03083 family)